MDFSLSPKVEDLRHRLIAFMDEHVYAAEKVASEQVHASGDQHLEPPIMKELKKKARAQGLWNLFLPDKEYGAGLNNQEYGVLCEVMGRSQIASRIFNCNAPDTGNMEILAEFGSSEQKKRWLQPLLDGEIRSCFSMTEPETAGSDPTLLRTRAVRDGDQYVINGHKWFTSGAYGAAFAIAMVVTDPDAPPHRRASQIIVPTDTPGFNLVRPVPVMGHTGGGGHAEVLYENCRVPLTNVLGGEGMGFAIAQARLGPGRIHHCMRCIGAAERAFELMCKRANTRYTHGSLLAEKGIIQTWIADSRIEIDSARLMVLNAAWKMDTIGKKEARQEIAMIKVVVPNMMLTVLDRAIQVHGAMGVSDDTPIARMWRDGRSMRIADGPDEVHKMTIARRELRKWAS
ncbi:MAG: acyl-CoA dehydrogenase family protein [Deltaproteobacteria bacterium]|nr:acyl-CoA dehydrogenase family protein [Deltaproteobacteria bacterium]MBI3389135.1 acyl-CoA dehydrogenase family protein [Deltaproteobacteria bacterium]